MSEKPIDLDTEIVTKEEQLAFRNSLSPRVQELLDELPKGRECQKCGGQMYHSRLNGYQCFKGCHQ